MRFLGTRGEIEYRSPRHRLHSSLLVMFRKGSLIIDYGLDWLVRAVPLEAQAILLTHAHPDHVGGLRRGAPRPVYATEETVASDRALADRRSAAGAPAATVRGLGD